MNELIKFNDEQLKIITNDICKGANRLELEYFLSVAKRSGLDPFAKQIYLIPRKDEKGDWVKRPQTSIDGYRMIAHRTGQCAGIDEPIFDDENKPTRATVTVYRLVNGQRMPFTATARWNEYYPGEKLGFMWRAKPCTMLGKCAEAAALRKAFPFEFSGLYVDDEMGSEEEQPKQIISRHQRIVTAFKDLGVEEGDLETYLGCPLSEATESQIAKLQEIYPQLKNKKIKKEDVFKEQKALGLPNPKPQNEHDYFLHDPISEEEIK